MHSVNEMEAIGGLVPAESSPTDDDLDAVRDVDLEEFF